MAFAFVVSAFGVLAFAFEGLIVSSLGIGKWGKVIDRSLLDLLNLLSVRTSGLAAFDFIGALLFIF